MDMSASARKFITNAQQYHTFCHTAHSFFESFHSSTFCLYIFLFAIRYSLLVNPCACVSSSVVWTLFFFLFFLRARVFIARIKFIDVSRLSNLPIIQSLAVTGKYIRINDESCTHSVHSSSPSNRHYREFIATLSNLVVNFEWK